MHGHFDLKKSHFDSRNRVPDDDDEGHLNHLCYALLGFRMSFECWALFCWKSGQGKCHNMNQLITFM